MAHEEKSRNWFMRHKIWTAIIVLFALGAVSSAVNPPKTSPATKTSTQSVQAPKDAPKPAKKSDQEIYDQTQVGMSKDQVVQIAGRNPDNCTDSEIAGLGTSSACSWGSASIIFMNGNVESKTKL